MNFFTENTYGNEQEDYDQMKEIGKKGIKVAVNYNNQKNNEKSSQNPNQLLSIALVKIKYALIFLVVDGRIDIQPANGYQDQVKYNGKPVNVNQYIDPSLHLPWD
jgi:hypothetical protein